MIDYASDVANAPSPVRSAARPGEASTAAGVAALGVFANLELRHLAALDAVATEGTFGRAAERLGYTQSAVSQQIGALERAVGGSVFDRPGGPRPVRLTPLGKVMLSHARELLARAASSADAIERFRAGADGRIDIGTFQSVSSVLLPAMIASLRAEYPNADIRLHEDESTAATRLVNGDLDLIFTVAPTRPDFVTTTLLDDPFVLVARRGEFARGEVAIHQLDGVQMVQYPAWCDVSRIGETLAELGVSPIPVFESTDNGTIVAMVRAGLGPAISPLLCVDIEPDDPDLELHALDPPIRPRTIQLAWLPDRTQSPIASRFIEIATDVAAALTPEEATYYATAR